MLRLELPDAVGEPIESQPDDGAEGRFYAFDSMGNATRFVTDYFPSEAQALDVAYTTRLFDAGPVVEASQAMGSAFFR